MPINVTGPTVLGVPVGKVSVGVAQVGPPAAAGEAATVMGTVAAPVAAGKAVPVMVNLSAWPPRFTWFRGLMPILALTTSSGSAPRGLVAMGLCMSPLYLTPHW